VIRYKGTLSSVDESASDRGRQEALALANAIANRARDAATPFASLVSQYSEHADRECQGDMGVWSTVAPGDKPREIETLSRLEIGEVAAPIDTIWGFQVLRRIEASIHERTAMAALRFKFGPSLPPEDPRSQPSVYTEAFKVAQDLHRRPAAFAEASAQRGNAAVESWEWGHGPPQVMLALEKLHIGEVAEQPVHTPFFFVVPMRLDPVLTAHSDPALLYELPDRSWPDLRQTFHDADSATLASRIAEFQRPEVEAAIDLSEAEKVTFRSTLEGLRRNLQRASDADARVRAYDVAIRQLAEGLPQADYSKLMGFFEQEAARIILANP
jgi:hypothetical protein